MSIHKVEDLADLFIFVNLIYSSSFTQVCGRELLMEELQEETGEMMEKLTLLTQTFSRLNLHPEEFVCLKVLLLLSRGKRSSISTEMGEAPSVFILMVRM